MCVFPAGHALVILERVRRLSQSRHMTNCGESLSAYQGMSVIERTVQMDYCSTRQGVES